MSEQGTRARFYDPHNGVHGAIGTIPVDAYAIAHAWANTEGDPKEFASDLARRFPDGKVSVRTPGVRDYGGIATFGAVTLRIPAEGFPANIWHVIKFDWCD